MRKLSKKISMLMVLAMLVGLFSGVVSASAASAWSFASGKYDVAVNGSINMESKEYADFDLLKDGAAPAGYTVAWASSDEDVVWVNAKTGQLRANKFGKAADGDKAVISATFTNTATKKSATRSFTIVLGAAKADFTVEAADVTIALGEEVKFAPVVKDAAGNVVKFATHKSYNGYFLDGKAIANPWTPEEAGEYTVTVAQFAKKADVADLAKAVRKDEVKVTVTVNADFDAKATGVREITAYGDFAKDAQIVVKKGTATIAIAETKIAEDGKSAVLALSGKLSKGTYTVSYGDAKVELAIEDEKVASIVILDDGKVVTVNEDRDTAYVHYDVFNQYGESVRKSYSVNWTASTGATVKDIKSTGTLEIPADKDGDEEFIYGTTIIITGVHTSAGNVATVNGSVIAGLENKVSTVEIAGIVKENKYEFTTLPAGFSNGDYLMLYKAYDQMGYEMKLTADVVDSLNFTSLSPLLIDSKLVAVDDFITIDGETYAAVRLLRGIQAETGGIAKIQVTSKATGVTKVHEITLVAEQTLATFTLLTPDFVVAEGDGTIDIPYEAYDQNGLPVKDFRVLHEAVTLSGDGMYIKKNADGSATVKYDVPADADAEKNVDIPRIFTSTVIKTGSSSTITIVIKDEAVPTTVKSLGAWHNPNQVEAGSVYIMKSVDDNDNGLALVYYDQYDRQMDNKKAYARFDKYDDLYVAYATTGAAYTVTGGGAEKEDYVTFDAINLAANDNVTTSKLTQSVEFVVIDARDEDNVEVGAEKKISFANYDLSQVRSFEFNGFDAKIKNNSTTGYNVKGNIANGVTVDIPAKYLRVSASDKDWAADKATYTGNTITPVYTEPGDFKDKSDDTDMFGNAKDITRGLKVKMEVFVTVDGNDIVRDTLEGETVVDDDAVKAATLNKHSWLGDTATVEPTNGTLTYGNLLFPVISSYTDNYDDLKDEYKLKWYMTKDIKVTISKLVENEAGLHNGSEFDEDYDADNATVPALSANALEVVRTSCQGADGSVVMLNGAETGDTFVVTYEKDDAKLVMNIVVGADTTAKFDTVSDHIIWR